MATNYTGTVHFTSTDSQAGLPGNYTFTSGDNGVHTFTNGITFKTARARPSPPPTLLSDYGDEQFGHSQPCGRGELHAH